MPGQQWLTLTLISRALQLYDEERAQLSLNDPDPGPSTPAPRVVATDDVAATEATTKECQVCFEDKHTDLFPQTTVANNCRCLSDACLVCVQEHMRAQLSIKEWKEGSITCPMCNRSLTHQEIDDYADGETLAR